MRGFFSVVLILILCVLDGYSQVSVKGNVYDSKTGKPIGDVYVCAYSANRLCGYTFTDTDGNFSITVKENAEKKPYKLTFSHVGYLFTTVAADKDEFLGVEMKLSVVELETVKVSATRMIRQNDTASYNMDSLRHDADENLKAVLVKIPGITVSDKGLILHKGKPIDKFYIEGLDVLDNRYAIATENLDPANIDKVEVISHHQPIAALDGMIFSDKSAVNIVLKSDAKDSWLLSGDVSAGYREDTAAVASGRLWLANFKKKHQTVCLVKGNNAGNDILNELQNLRSYEDGKVFVSRGAGVLESDFEGPFGILRTVMEFPEEYYFDNHSAILSLNHVAVNNNGLQYRLGLQGAVERWKESESECQIIHFPDESTLTLNEADERLDEKVYFNAEAGFRKNDRKKYFTDNLSIIGQFRRHNSLVSSSQYYDQKYRMPSVKLNNVLKSIIRLNDKKALTVTSNTDAVANLHSFKLNESIGQTTEYVDAETDNNVAVKLSAGNVMFDVKGGVGLDYHYRFTELSGTFESLDTIGKTYNRMSAFTVSPKLSAEMNWRKRGFNIMLSFPVSMKYMHICNSGIVSDSFFPDITPSMYFEWVIVSDLKLFALANYSLYAGNADNLLAGYILKNYRILSNSGKIPELRNYNAMLNLSYSSVLGRFTTSLQAGINGGSSTVAQSAMYYDELTLLEVVDRMSVSQSVFAGVKFKKWIPRDVYSVEFSAEYRQNKLTSFLQNADSDNTVGGWSVSVGQNLNIGSWMQLSVDFRYSNSWMFNQQSEMIHSFRTSGNILITPIKPFSIKGSIFHLYQIVPGVNQTNTPLIKVGAEYRFRKFKIVAECANLLNVDIYCRESISGYSSVFTTNKMRPRTYSVGLRMSF